jgi:hypothetical protein
MNSLNIEGSNIRMDKDTGFVCITDIAKLDPAGLRNIENWMRNANTVLFIEAWEMSNNPDFNSREFAGIKNNMGSNNFHVYTKDLLAHGCSGIMAKAGRYGGTYCNVEWAIHFANWINPVFYVATIKAYRHSVEMFYGESHLLKRFAREMAAENLKLPTGRSLSALPPEADSLVERRFASIEADIINLAMWEMTAREWRIKFGEEGSKKNMRDFATAEELKTVATLQALSQEMQENQYSKEERLKRLRDKAEELIIHYCSSPAKKDLLLLAQHKRGWGRFVF